MKVFALNMTLKLNFMSMAQCKKAERKCKTLTDSYGLDSLAFSKNLS